MAFQDLSAAMADPVLLSDEAVPNLEVVRHPTTEMHGVAAARCLFIVGAGLGRPHGWKDGHGERGNEHELDRCHVPLPKSDSN